MAILKVLWLLASLLPVIVQAEVVAYWGQAGSAASDLLTACSQTSAGTIVVAFLTTFSSPFSSITASDINISGASLTTTGQQIGQCQSQHGKKVLLSIGGATFSSASAPWGSSSDAQTSAQAVYSAFLTSGSTTNPFGDGVKFDGIDLDIESVIPYIVDFATKLHELGGTEIMHAAPQCVWPDANLGEVLDSVPMNGVFIQFYNNECGIWDSNGFQGGVSAINTWAKGSPNSDVKLYIGTPASSTAIGSYLPQCYKSADVLSSVNAWASSGLANYAGFMVWDLGHSVAPGGLGMALDIGTGGSAPSISVPSVSVPSVSEPTGQTMPSSVVTGQTGVSTPPVVSVPTNVQSVSGGSTGTPEDPNTSFTTLTSTTQLTQTATVLMPSPSSGTQTSGPTTSDSENGICDNSPPPRSSPGQAWQQCGGKCWTGSTECTSGLTCTVVTDWWSDCRGSSNSKREEDVLNPATTATVAEEGAIERIHKSRFARRHLLAHKERHRGRAF